MLRPDLIPLDSPAARLSINGMQIHAMPPRDKRHRLLEVRPQLVPIPRLPRIIARSLKPAGGDACRGVDLKPTNIIPLPTRQRNRHTRKPPHRRLDIHPQRRIPLSSNLISALDELVF
jgi:hypothetical protein